MTQFQFGDIIRHKPTGEIFIICTRENPDKPNDFLLFAKDYEKYDFHHVFGMNAETAHKFELLRRPDETELQLDDEAERELLGKMADMKIVFYLVKKERGEEE